MSHILDEMVFDDLEGIKVPVSLKGKRYWLVEASVNAVNKFKSEVTKNIKFDSNGKPSSIGSIGDAETFLLSQCLYQSKPDGTLDLSVDNVPYVKDLVPLAVIKNWPSRVQEGLVKRLKTISDLDNEETEESLTKLMDETLQKLQKLKQDKSTSSQDTILKNE